MAVLTVRNVPDSVRDRLRLRAAKAGTSMEEQVRLILLQASLEPAKTISAASLPAWVASLYGQNKPRGVVEDLLNERAAAELAELGKSKQR
ncbi:MAG: FitA-like ribbon-helix-helix domain-containing protein [Pseudomarimonas sp.]